MKQQWPWEHKTEKLGANDGPGNELNMIDFKLPVQFGGHLCVKILTDAFLPSEI